MVRPEMLIGKKAVRTRPTKCGDFSFMESPVLITSVGINEMEVIYKVDETRKVRLKLHNEWLDNGWENYEDIESKMGKFLDAILIR